MTTELHISIDGRLGRIVLNRPAAINALSPGMIEGVTAVLAAWRDDAAVGAVLIEGNGPKGFCAGGDVRAARALVLEGRMAEAAAYFAAEYAMDGLIASYPKPIVVLSHGVVMGGGIGIAGHCGVRITQPGARFAMPEAAIGFVSDVGVNAILARAPLNRALLFVMSGASVGPADALALGLVDAVVAPARVAAIISDLAAAATMADPAQAITRLVEAESIEAGDASFCAAADLLPADPPASPAAFIASVEAVPALGTLAAKLRAGSPSTLAVNFYAQLQARRLMDVNETLAMDLRLARLMLRRPDFAEGVRAVLIDKDHKARWQPEHMSDIDAAEIIEAVASP